jgi:hypothetical protein
MREPAVSTSSREPGVQMKSGPSLKAVPPSALRSVVADLPAATEPRGRQTPDACYEEAMGRVVQVLV